MKKRHIILLFLMTWRFSFAQQYIYYNTNNGLPSNHVYRITQDNQGFIWIITDNGIVKFNGYDFKIFTTKEGLPTNDIWDIRITPDNKIWYFSKSDHLGYIYKDSVYSFPSEKKKILYPVVINQNGENIFFNNAKSYHFLKNNKWKDSTITSKENDTFIEKVYHHNIDYFINNTIKNKLKYITVIDKKGEKIKNIPIIANDKEKFKHRGQVNDSLFVWIYNDKIKILNLNSLKFYIEPISNKAQLTRFSAVNDKIQFSGENYVAFLDKNYHLIHYKFIPKKLNSHFSFIDKNDNTWIATFNNGIYFLSKPKQQANFLLTDNKVRKLQLIKGKIITSILNKGFYEFDSVSDHFNPIFKIKDFLYSATYIKPLNTSFYISDKKVIIIKNNKKKEVDNFEITRKLIHFNNKLYGFNSRELNQIEANSFSIKKEFIQNGIRDITPFNDKILIATSNGLKYFKNNAIKEFPNLKTFKYPIISIKRLNNNQIIMGTDGFGAYITDFKNISLLEKTEFLNVNNAILHHKNIFLATNKGVWLYKKDHLKYRLIKKYTKNEGLNTNNINDVYVYNDKLMTASNKGVSIIPINQDNNNYFLDIYYDQINYANKPVLNNSIFKYGDNNDLQVKIGLIDFSDDKNFEYDYQLLPIQKKWIHTKSQHISFNNLQPNQYQLQIKSNHIKKNISFTIQPLWYQTSWFKTLTAFSFLLLISLIFYYFYKKEQNKQHKKLDEQKKLAEYELHALRSQMNPHFVFNSLNAIQYYITKNNIELSEKYLVKFARLIRMFFDFSREKEIPLTDEIRLLKGYLEIEKMRFGEDFNYKVNVKHHENIDAFKIPTMLLQPIVENAVNHGLFHLKGKGLIEITFDLVSKTKMIVTISDNGIGIKKSKEIQQNSIHHQKKNNSTQVIKERITLLNQSKKWKVTYKILEKEIGTTVQLTFIKNEEN